MTIDRFGASWGSKAAPVMPATLRELWRDESMPVWMSNDLGLSSTSTYSALSESIWADKGAIPERVFSAMAILVAQRSEQVAQVRCVVNPWPVGLQPDLVPWSSRTRNALKRNGIYSSLSGDVVVTFGRIMAIPGAGVRSALDYAATLESAMREFGQAGSAAVALLGSGLGSGPTAADNSSIVDTVEAYWAAQISKGLPRFSDVLGIVTGMSLKDYLLDALTTPDAASRTNEIAYS